jgi:transposase
MNKIKIHPIKLGALPIIHHFARKLDLLKLIEKYVPQDAREVIPASQTLYAILCNVILERFPLYKIGEWSVERGLFSIDYAKHLNDDRIGRALHRLFRSDRATLLTQIVLKAIEEFSLNMDRLHNDSTSVTLFGQYDIKHKAAKPKHGYNKDHRPDLKQLIFNLTVCGDGAVPVYFKVLDGNITDDKTHLRNWISLRNLLGKSDFTYIADCKLCTKENMEFIDSEHGWFITVLPETRSEDHKFKEWMQTNSPTWIEAIRRTGKRKNDPDSVYWVFDSPFLSVEGFRIIWVLSSNKQKLDEHKRTIFIEKTITAFKEIESVQHKNYTKLEKRIRDIFVENKTEKYFYWQITTQVQSSYKQLKRGRPSQKTSFRKVDKVFYGLSWSHNQEQIRYDAKCDGLFPLITNTKEPAQYVLESYKYQPYLEKRHQQLKSVYDVAPVFLKHPERIEGLLFIYFLGMLITALIERGVRQSMQKAELPSIPIYPEKRLCKKPTADKILDLFRDIRLQTVVSSNKILEVVADEFNEVQNQILKLLDIRPEEYFCKKNRLTN